MLCALIDRGVPPFLLRHPDGHQFLEHCDGVRIRKLSFGYRTCFFEEDQGLSILFSEVEGLVLFHGVIILHLPQRTHLWESLLAGLLLVFCDDSLLKASTLYRMQLKVVRYLLQREDREAVNRLPPLVDH